jgi:hypothetical protein
MAFTLRVRQGGESPAVWRDYSSMVPSFEVDEGQSLPLIQGGNSVQNGGAGHGEFMVIDDTSLIPASDGTWSLAAHNVVEWFDDGPGFDCWLMRGRIASKTADRGDHPAGDSRTWHVSVEDANDDIDGLDLDADWVRGAETGVARVLAAVAAFCNGSPRLSTVISTHLVPNSVTVTMPAKTYVAGTDLREIFADCSTTEGKIFGVVIHHTALASHLCLQYIDELDHSTFPSALRISDTPADHNFTETNRLLNLAGASIKVSSTSPTFVKTRAVDGDYSDTSHWSAEITQGVDEEWWAGDLGSSLTVDYYRIVQGNLTAPSVNETATEMKVYGSTDAAAWTWLPAGKLVADPASNGWTLLQTIGNSTQDTGARPLTPTSYRYFLLRASEGPAAGVGDGWNVQEFEVGLSLTLPPDWDPGPPSAEEGAHLVSKLVNRWGNNQVSVASLGAAQTDAYDYWSRSYNDALSVTASQAASRATAVLTDLRYEHVTHTVSLRSIPATMLDIVTAGQSIQIKSAAAMGGQYLGTWQTRRVVDAQWQMVSPSATAATRLYDVTLQLDRPMRTTAAGVAGSNLALVAATGVKNNYGATTAPTATDDADDGYTVGSHWFDTTADKEYVALDVTVGAAVWKTTNFTLVVQENDTTVDAAATTLDFGNGLDVTSSPAGEANIVVDPTEIKLDDLGAPDDNTDLNATTSVHGLLLKLGGGSTNFLRADGTWAAPSGGGGGAPTAAEYITAAAHADLSAEIVIPGLAAHGSIAGLGGGGITEEYDTTTTGLTWSPTTPSTVDSDTTVPSHLYLTWTGSGNVETLGLRSWSPAGAAAFDARMHVAMQKAISNNASVGLIVTDSGDSNRSLMQLTMGTTSLGAEAFTYGSGAYTQRGSTWTSLGQGKDYYLRITRDGSNNVSFYWSGSGRIWTLVATQAHTYTVANIGIRLAENGTTTILAISDFLRTDV